MQRSTTLMKAVRVHEYGGPDALCYEDVPVPSFADDEVLVAVHAAGVNPVDWKVREGYLRDAVGHQLPLIPGWDVSGEVIAMGRHVQQFNVGDAVYGRPDIGRDGCYAEYVAVKADELAPKPRNLSHVESAAVPLAALTAWQALFEAPAPYTSAGLLPEQKVLIHGAAGGVGTFAVQLARWRGAYVLGTGSAHSADFLTGLGVHEFINYEAEHFETRIRDIDVVIDTIGGETQRKSWQMLKPGGSVVSIVERPDEALAQRYGARTGYVFVQPHAEQLIKLRELIEKHAIKPVVTEVLPLKEARKAHRHSQTGHTHGKIVLEVRDVPE